MARGEPHSVTSLYFLAVPLSTWSFLDWRTDAALQTAPAIGMAGISTNPQVWESAPAAGIGERTSPFRSGPRLLFSHQHCPRGAGVCASLPTRTLALLLWGCAVAKCPFRNVLSAAGSHSTSLSAQWGSTQPIGHLPHLSAQIFLTCCGALGSPLCSVGEANPLHFSPTEALGGPKPLALGSLGGHLCVTICSSQLSAHLGSPHSQVCAAVRSVPLWPRAEGFPPCLHPSVARLRKPSQSAADLLTPALHSCSQDKVSIITCPAFSNWRTAKNHVLCSVYSCVFRSWAFCVWNSPGQVGTKQTQGCC